MPISWKLGGLPTPTLPTVPVHLTSLGTDASWLAFLPSQFGLLFCFQKRWDNRLEGDEGCRFGWLLHFLQDACALFAL